MTDTQSGAALPAPVAEFVSAVNRFDAAGIAAVFTEDALVNDARREFSGRPAIRRWVEREITGDKVTMNVSEVRFHRGAVIVDAVIDGEYDKTGLPDVVVLTHYVAIAGDQIAQMIIIRNEPAPAWAAGEAGA